MVAPILSELTLILGTLRNVIDAQNKMLIFIAAALVNDEAAPASVPTWLLLLHEIERDGFARINLDPLAVALLAYLTCTARSHSRNALAALLWPNGSHSNARAALRRTFWSLNKALHGEGLMLVTRLCL